MTKLKLLILLVAAMPTVVLAKNRINAEKDPGIACYLDLDPEACEFRRSRGLRLKCISPKEYQSLIEYGSYPICENWTDINIYELTGWCPCNGTGREAVDSKLDL